MVEHYWRGFLTGVLASFIGGYTLYSFTKQQASHTRALPIEEAAFFPSETQPLDVTAELLERASKQLNIPKSELVVRSLTPEDLGMGTKAFGFDVGVGANTIVNSTIADNRFIAIAGVAYAGTAIDQVDINAGGSARAVFNLMPVFVKQTPIAYTPEPVIIEQNQGLTITAHANAVSTNESLGFLGVVVEKRGLVIGRD